MLYANYNEESKMFPNQTVLGRDPELYPKKEKEIPRRYHNYLKEDDKKNIYPDLYKDDDNDKEDPEEPGGEDPKDPTTDPENPDDPDKENPGETGPTTPTNPDVGEVEVVPGDDEW